MRSTTARGTARPAGPVPISILVALYNNGGPAQTLGQPFGQPFGQPLGPSPVYRRIAACQQSKWEVNDFEANLDAAIFGARVGPEGLSEAAAKKILAGAPWYASSLRTDLNSTEFLRKLNMWSDSQTVETLITQQKTLRKCQEVLRNIFAAFEIGEHSKVCERGLTEFSEYFWKEVRLSMASTSKLTAALTDLKVPANVASLLRDTSPSTPRKSDVDDDDDSFEDSESDAQTVIDLLSQDTPPLSVDQERVHHALSEFKAQVENTVKIFTSVYGDAILRTQSNPLVAGASGLQPNTFGSYRPLDSIVSSFSSSANSWYSKDVTLPDASQLSKTPAYNLKSSATERLFTAPITNTVVPHVSRGWENQVAMMEYLGRPADHLTALARVRSLKAVLERLQIVSKKTSESLSTSFKLAMAIGDVLRSPKWKSLKPHMRWMRACIMSRMAEIMRVSKNGDAIAKLMGGYISDPPPLDYEYLRLVERASMKDRHNAPDIAYDWLTDAEKKGETLHPVIVQEEFVHDASLSISEARLQRAGLYDRVVVTGDVDYAVPPLYITAESLALIEDLTRNGAKIMTYEEMNAPDPKELDVEIKYDSDKTSTATRILEDRIPDAERFELIKKSGRLYEAPVRGSCLKKPKYMR